MRLDQFLADLLRRTSEIERRFDGMVSQGTVHEVDPQGGTVRLRIGGTDDEPFLSPPIPYAQVAGALKVHAPPSRGQQMTVLNGSGDFRQGLALPMTWSDANKSPSDKGDENVMTFGSATVAVRGDEIVVKVPRLLIECDGTTLELSGNGLRAVASDFDFSQG